MIGRGTFAVAARIGRQILRDRRALALVIIAPAVIMTLFAVILDAEEPRPRIALKASGLVAVFLDSFEELLAEPEDPDDAFTVEWLDEDEEPLDAIQSGRLDAVMEFPETFLEDRASGRRSELTLYVEGADPTRTAAIFSRFRKALPEATVGFPKLLHADCPSHCAETIPDAPPEIDLIKLYGDEIDKNMDFFVPVLPPFFAFFFVFLLSGMAFLKERTSGTAERLLASPLSKGELVGGYVLGFLPLAMVQAALVIAYAALAIGGPWGGWPVIAAVLLLALVAECMGVFVSAFARSEFQVFQFIPIIIIPQILLSGIIWPIADFPVWLKPVAWAMPMTYAVNAIRDAAIRGMGFAGIWPDLAILALFAAGAMLLASLTVRKGTVD
ncbi:MAG: ABC transporter permease [Pseudomonadota bacterium]